ncbi:SUF system FeS assembly protein, NifU family [Planktothrix sp. PCC 11201]|uniref:Fe-S cluster assembly sulfur transfer protein SufU n=1 Tax=Planktothrix sp. PCC 11201 TaxID=1729650 RepID=UPI00092197FA|nr:SUF system NifU family Fe-S cluster assembly protein [Planktothrix sp. PCC 11201]SKB11115.1 SUF system FeS assembly protein, NifU family [Planktothrix sp. PCC 11201]
MNFPPSQRHISQQVILEHAQKPRHRGKTNPIHLSQEQNNPYCGDIVQLTIELDSTGDLIKDIKFEGRGCAVSMASADLMAEVLRGKTITESLLIIQDFLNLIQGNYQFNQPFEKLNVFTTIVQFPIRMKCAALSWSTLETALKSYLHNPILIECERRSHLSS